MILFAAPIGIAAASRRPAPYQHVSMWRLLGGELVAALKKVRSRIRRLVHTTRRT